METVYLGLGSNLGNREENLRVARQRIDQLPGVFLTCVSSLYETSPWGIKDQTDFLNQVVQVITELSPQEVLRACQQIESDLGRKREIRWGPRNIDIDILLYGVKVLVEEDLIIPHPYLTERAFVLVPLIELAPGLILPGGQKIEEVLQKALKLDQGSITML